MSLTVDLPEDVMRRLEAVAVARGVSVEELVAETLAQVAPIDRELAETVTATIAEHREILDRLAET
jgi:predicted transcriptional regulator